MIFKDIEMIKNVIFDLGGVVVNWSPQRLLDTYPGDRELPVMLFERGFFERYWTEFDRGTVKQTELVKEMAAFAGRHYAECWDFMEFIKHSLDDLLATCRLIGELSGKGYRLFCLSNMSEEYYDYLKDREVFHFFEGRVISALEGLIKPDPAIYRLITERYALVPGETLFVDDLEANVRAAQECGLHAYHFADREKGIAELRRLLL